MTTNFFKYVPCLTKTYFTFKLRTLIKIKKHPAMTKRLKLINKKRFIEVVN